MMTVLFYALNGIGLGHVRRSTALANAFRIRAQAKGLGVNGYFVSSSEADNLLFRSGWPSFKVPSQTAADLLHAEAIDHRRLSTRVIRTLIEDFSPDLLVVDTAPMGAFDEFLPNDEWSVRHYCRRLVLLLRPVQREIATSSRFTQSIVQYDRVIIPENRRDLDKAFLSALPLPEDRVSCVGPVFNFDTVEVPTRSQARSLFNVADDDIVVYVSTGGGGFRTAIERLEIICSTLSLIPHLRVLVLSGPLYRGSQRPSSNVAWCHPSTASQAMAAADFAVSAVGYNSFLELMANAVPAIFFPLASRADDQIARALRAVHAGAAQLLPMNFSRTELLKAVELWLKPPILAMARRATANIASRNCADVAADQLLEVAAL